MSFLTMKYIEDRSNTYPLVSNKVSFLKTFAYLKSFNELGDEKFYSEYRKIYKKEIDIFRSFTRYVIEKLKLKPILSKNLIVPDYLRCFITIVEDEKNYLKIFDSQFLSQKDLDRIQYLLGC